MAAEANSLGPAAEPSATPNPVIRERTDDPITGLPLLRYRFAGSPTMRPGDPAPAGAWRVLRVVERDGWTVLDLESSAGAAPLDRRPQAVDDALVGRALAILGHARDAGVAHGDLGAHRLWRRGDRLWIEGYGVRWRDDADLESDARALADGLLNLAGTRLAAATRTRLRAVRERGDPAALPEPAAGECAGLAAPSATAPAVTAASVVLAPPPGARVRRGGRGFGALLRRGTVEAPIGPPPSTPSAAAPPLLGAGQRRRLVAALALATLAWAGLATWGELRPSPGSLGARPVQRVVEVQIDPPGQPPVHLVVVASPPGSLLPPGTVVASVPSTVVLDRDGHWRLEARFAELRSPAQDLQLPFDRRLTLPFPSLARTAAP